ncbi:MAG TPA: hypothetical protein VHE81_22295 [Lacipirellulaceae bacterium]|nr:hypothetical protein [Lacipirellulaceae bacterium]
MIRRSMLAVTFLAAMGAASVGFNSKAMAWNDCNSGIGYPYPYSTYAAFGPRLVYYPTYPIRTYPAFYANFYGHHRQHDHHHHHHHDGVAIGFHF